jgi:hypothetical protein
LSFQPMESRKKWWVSLYSRSIYKNLMLVLRAQV